MTLEEKIDAQEKQIADWSASDTEPFPRTGWGAVDFPHIVDLDSTIAGCVSSFVNARRRGEQLSPRKIALIGICYGEILPLCDQLTGEAAKRFFWWRDVAKLTLETIAAREYLREEP